MTRKDIIIIRQAVEISPGCWHYDGQDADSWNRVGQTTPDNQRKNEAYLIAGTLQLLNGADTTQTIQRTTHLEARLTATKPRQ
jgi:hypothetical protein